LAATLAVLAAGCGSSVNGDPSAPALQRVASLTLVPSGKSMSWRIPVNWAITMRVWFPRARSTLRVGVGSAALMVFDGSHVWHRVRLTSRGLVVDRRVSGGSSNLKATKVSLEALHGPVEVQRLVIRRTKR
jgi:hypothetical protein